MNWIRNKNVTDQKVIPIARPKIIAARAFVLKSIESICQIIFDRSVYSFVNNGDYNFSKINFDLRSLVFGEVNGRIKD